MYDIASINTATGGDEWRIDSGAVRIAILGGSHVFDMYSLDCSGTPPWPELIQAELRGRGYRVQTFNLGVPGAATPDIVARAMYDLPALSPHIVILNSIWNDLKWIVRFSRPLTQQEPGAMRPNPFVEKVGILDDALGWSAVYRKLRDAYYRYQYNINGTGAPLENLQQKPAGLAKQDAPTGLRQYELNLTAFVNIVRSFGGEPILAIEELLVHPHNTSEQRKKIRYDFITANITHEQLVHLFSACDSVIREVSEQLNVRTIDVNKLLLSNPDVFFSDHIHTTPEGSKALARGYTDLLEGSVQLRQSQSRWK